MPRSKRPTTWRQPANRTALCAFCHHWATEVASPSHAVAILRQNRRKILGHLGRSERDLKRLEFAQKLGLDKPAKV